MFRLLFLCSYSVVFYLVNFNTNSIINSSKVHVLKIFKCSSFDKVICWIVPLIIDEFGYFYSHIFQLEQFYAICTVNERTSIIMKHSFSFKHSVHWGINAPSKTPPSPFLPSPPLKSANCQSPPFLGNPPHILVFREPPLWKSDFSVNSKNIKVFHS